MRKTYFPRAKFVRRLEQIYLEVTAYRSSHTDLDMFGWPLPTSPRLTDRLHYLEHVEQALSDLIQLFNEVPSLS